MENAKTVTLGLCGNYLLFDDVDSMITMLDKDSFKEVAKYNVNSYDEDDESSGRFPHAFYANSKNIFVAFSNGSFEAWDHILKPARRNQTPSPTVVSKINLPDKTVAMKIAPFEDNDDFLILGCKDGVINMYNTKSHQIEQTYKIQDKHKQIGVIIDVIRTSSQNEYCLLSRNGMFFIRIEKTGK